MKAASLIQKLKKKLIKYGVVLFVLLTLFFVSSSFYKSSLEAKTNVNSQLSASRLQMIEKQDAYKLAEENLAIFSQMPEKLKPTKDGFSVGYMRVKQLMPIYEELKAKYKFKKIDIQVGEIIPSSRATSEGFEAFESTIEITFQGATDEYIISFINDLGFLLSGYIEIDSINISKKAEITPETIEKYKKDAGFYFVEGKIMLNWITLKAKEIL